MVATASELHHNLSPEQHLKMLHWRQKYAIMMQSEQQILQLKRQLTSKLWKLQDGHETLAAEATNMPSQLHDNCILIFI